MTQVTTPWQPILTGAQQAQALAVVADVAAHLAQQPATSHYSPDLALFFAYWERFNSALPIPHHSEEGPATDRAERAVPFLQGALERVASEPLGAGLYGGLAGTGWVLAHLANWVYAADEDDPNAAIDAVLYEHLSQTPWDGDYDLINGLVGIGVYAVARLPSPTGVQLLAQVVARLANLAIAEATGITWRTPPHLLPEPQRRDFPHGYYNLGLSHGIPGVIALLGHAVAAGVATATVRPLLHGAVRWLLAQDPAYAVGTETGGDSFPAFVADRRPTPAARLAWCYGDVGIAAALLGTARRVNEPAWAAEAIRIARRAAQRPVAQSGVHDGCLCHGAAGLAHLFNRFYQATGEQHFLHQARFWIKETMTLRQPAQGIAGYCFWRGAVWVDTPGFLEGAAGIGLALLAAATPITPAWDRLLLVDL